MGIESKAAGRFAGAALAAFAAVFALVSGGSARADAGAGGGGGAAQAAQSAQALHPLAAPGTPAWQPLEFPGVPRHTRYTTQRDSGREAVRSSSECAASALILPTPGLALQRTPHLAWQWRVEQGLDIADERAREGDDFAARVYVAFRFEPDKASAWQRWRRRAVELVYGAELPGRALNYVWSSREPAGRAWDNPRTADSRMLSLGRGPLANWRRERVDVLEDYRRSFGEAPPGVLFVAVMTDSDDSCSRASAWFADFRFEGAEP